MYRGLNRGRMRVVILPSSSHFRFSSSNIGTPPTFGVQFSKLIRSDALQAFLKVLTFAYSFFYLIMQYELQCSKFPQ